MVRNATCTLPLYMTYKSSDQYPNPYYINMSPYILPTLQHLTSSNYEVLVGDYVSRGKG